MMARQGRKGTTTESTTMATTRKQRFAAKDAAYAARQEEVKAEPAPMTPAERVAILREEWNHEIKQARREVGNAKERVRRAMAMVEDPNVRDLFALEGLGDATKECVGAAARLEVYEGVADFFESRCTDYADEVKALRKTRDQFASRGLGFDTGGRSSCPYRNACDITRAESVRWHYQQIVQSMTYHINAIDGVKYE